MAVPPQAVSGALVSVEAMALWLLLTLQPCMVSAGSSLFPQPNAVFELTPDAFDGTVLGSKKAWLVVFYSHWCGHCVRYAPTWTTIAEQHRSERRVGFAAVDCAEYSSFCSTKDVHAYPTVRAFGFPALGNVKPTDGADVRKRTETDVASWLAEQLSHLPALPAEGDSAGPPPGGAVAANTAAADASVGAKADTVVAASGGRGKADLAATPEDRLVDAEVAMLVSFHQGVFLNASRVGDGPETALSGAPLLELQNWLDLFQMLSPSSTVATDLEELSRLVRVACTRPEGLLRSEWDAVVGRVSLDGLPAAAGLHPGGHWRACTTYTCGLWTLFHLLTVAVDRQVVAASASWGGFLTPAAALGPTPEDVMLRIRGFVKHFFGCEECARHLLHDHDSCRFGLCELARGDTVGYALWLWEVHNTVSRRIVVERAGGAAVAREALVEATWPSRKTCGECWRGEGTASWNGAATYKYMLAAYWRPGWMPGGQDNARFFLAAAGASLIALGAVARLACLWLRPPQRRRQKPPKGAK